MTSRISGSISLVQVVSLSFGLLFLIAVIFLVEINPCATNIQVSTYRTILAIAVAGVAAVIPGFFKFRYKGIVSASGAIGVFAFVYSLNPAFVQGGGNCNFNLPVVFHVDDYENKLQEDVKANFLYAGRDLDATIIDGRLTLYSIPQNSIGDSIQVIIESGKYLLAKHPILIPEPGSILQILLKKKQESTTVKGEIRDRNFLPIKSARLVINGVNGNTDEEGRYTFSIPFGSGIYNLQVFIGTELIYNRAESITEQFFTLKIENYVQKN
ncbi:hypothetical protein [Aquiflexum lacus]|uniref:hypothetical protein n=1 Tax=Aquiflexum lacus TaxID=2483805 RepID=UPI0018931277|nr:hypothetical protein [Aquiflexum lacus]